MLAEAGGGRWAVEGSGQSADLEKNEGIVRGEQQGNERPW